MRVFWSIEKIIFNPPATIVFWSDGDKTVVKAHNEPFDREKGLAMAILKKIWAGSGHYRNFFKAACSNDALYLRERYGVNAEYRQGSEKYRGRFDDSVPVQCSFDLDILREDD